jgi:hypothetical protein
LAGYPIDINPGYQLVSGTFTPAASCNETVIFVTLQPAKPHDALAFR